MEIEVTPKKWYVVSGTAGTTVSKPDGTVVATVPDGGQTAFLATTYTVVTSNAKVEIVESTFNFALALLGLQGGGNSGDEPTEVPSEYITALFLESTGTQNIKLTDTVDRDTGLMATYQTGEGKCWATLGYFCTANSSALTLPYRGDWSESLQNNWFWRWYTYTFTDLPVPDVAYRPNNYTKPLTGAVNWMVSKGAGIQFEGASTFKGKTWYDSFVETYTGLTLCASSYKTFSVKVSQEQNVTRDMVPAITPTGEPCLYDKVTRQSFYNSGTGAFIVGLTMAQARKLWKLPADVENKTLTISLPQSAFVDTETGEIADAEINAALETAELKGWTITIQTY